MEKIHFNESLTLIIQFSNAEQRDHGMGKLFARLSERSDRGDVSHRTRLPSFRRRNFERDKFHSLLRISDHRCNFYFKTTAVVESKLQL
jgi:hypothetical protein